MFPFLLPLLGIGAGLLVGGISSHLARKRYERNVPRAPQTYPLEVEQDYYRMVEGRQPQEQQYGESTFDTANYDVSVPGSMPPPTPEMLRDFYDDMTGIERHVVVGEDGISRYEVVDKRETPEEKEYKKYLRQEYNKNLQWAITKSRENHALMTEQYRNFINDLNAIGQERKEFLKKDESFQNIDDDLKYLKNYTTQSIKQQFDDREKDLINRLAMQGFDINSSRGLQERALLERERNRALRENDLDMITMGNTLSRDRLETRKAYYDDKKQKWQDRLNEDLSKITALEQQQQNDYSTQQRLSNWYADSLQKDAYRRQLSGQDVNTGLQIQTYNRNANQAYYNDTVQDSQRQYENQLRANAYRVNLENNELQRRLSKYQALLQAKTAEWRANTSNAQSTYQGQVDYEQRRPPSFGERIGHLAGRALTGFIGAGFNRGWR